MDYVSLTSDDAILSVLPSFEEKERIAVDFEGEFNLHVYGEHLCLVQIFDGERFFIIDPRAKGVTRAGLEAFFSSPVKKVWFECQSDAALVSKVYGLSIASVFDIRVLASALGSKGNLKSLESEYLSLDNGIPKKKNQQANWMIRPLPEEQIIYALEDVAHLLELEDVLVPLVKERGLEKSAASAMKAATAVKKPLPGWTKVGGWKRMSAEEKVYARHIYNARDAIARRFNVPAARVMDKHLMPELARHRPSSEKALASLLSSESERFRGMLVPAMWKALGDAAAEISEKGRGK